MIIKYFELNQKKIKERKYVLFYGKNKGLIDDTIKEFIEPLCEEKILKYDESEIIKNSQSFIEDISNRSFFEKEKFIFIFRATDKVLKIIEEICDKNLDGIFILLISDTLEKKSKLRKFFETSKNTICVAFYEDNSKTLNTLAINFFRNKKISLSQQNINLLVERSRGDRLNLYKELDKIENYLRTKKQIKFDEILKLTNLGENYEITELIDCSLSKNQKKTLDIINENNFADEDTILILRVLIKRLKRLLKIHLENLNEKNLEITLSKFKPPIFWKEKELVKKQINIWDLNEIKKLLIKVSEIELLVKKNPANSTMIVTDFILEQANN